MDPGGHAMLRAVQRLGVPDRKAGQVARDIRQAAQKAGGPNKLLPKRDFAVPIRVRGENKGTMILTPQGNAGHRVTTILGPEMTPQRGTVPFTAENTGLSGKERREFLKSLGAAVSQ